jgi:lysophospholipase L1-like esterase
VTITCPQPVALTSPLGQPIPVAYPEAIGASGAPPVTVSCTPASATVFPIGATTVTCTATDSRQRTASCQFGVTVTMPPRIAVTRFVAFGDSITAGEIGDPVNPTLSFYSPGQAYPADLQQVLTARYTLQRVTVGNQGSPGERAVEGATRFRSATPASLFDVVLLMEGSNDIATNDTRTIAPAAGALQQMIRDAKARGLRPYLATIPPMDPSRCVPICRGRFYQLVAPMNDAIRAVASTENVPLVDVNAALSTDVQQYIGADGLHPTLTGAEKIAETFFDAIKQTLETPATFGTAFSRRRGRR